MMPARRLPHARMHWRLPFLLLAVATGLALSRPALTDPMEFRGRIQLDALAAGPTAGKSHGELRRLYLGVKGDFANFAYVADIDFAGFNDNELMLQDLRFTWNPEGDTRILAGHFKPPVISENITSDLNTLFLERSAYATIFPTGRYWGAAVDHMPGRWGFQIGVFGARGAELVHGDFDTVRLVAARLHGNPLHDPTAEDPSRSVLHLAASVLASNRPDRDAFSLRGKPEVNLAPEVLDTSRIHGEDMLFTGVELGFQQGPWLLQAEGGRTRLYRPATANPDLQGWSAQISWRPTGEARPYDMREGVFENPKPRQPLDEGGIGAFEVAARVGQTDLDDRDVRGGKLTTISAAASWFPIERVRLMMNWVNVDSRHRLLGQRDDNYVAMRAQVSW